jgi:hypothetical protein
MEDSAIAKLAYRGCNRAAGNLRESVVLGCASSCQVATGALGKLLNQLGQFALEGTHNAGVEGSSPSLSTNKQ